APVELPPARVRGGRRDRVAVRARRARDRRRGLGRAAGAGRRAAGAALGGGRGRARVLLRRQAARRPAGRAAGGPRRRRGGGRAGAGARPLPGRPGPAVALADASLAAAVRTGDPPLVGRVEGGRLLLDTRTLADDEVEAAAAAVAAASGHGRKYGA